MNDDRDLVVADALRRVTVPDHGPGFWSELEARLAGEPAPVAADDDPSPSPVRTSAVDEDEPEDEDEAAIVPLLPVGERRRGRSPLWLAAVAAVLVVVVGAVAMVNRPEPDAERLRVAEPSAEELPVTTPTTAPIDPPTTTPSPASAASTPDGAVIAWLDAVGAGDTERAAALTGPRSKAYADALTGGAGIEGFLTEAGEGYGAWADAPDRSTTEVELDAEGEDITIVVVSGTWTGEGGTAQRTDAIPAVRGDRGTWLVEPWAIEPATGGRIDVLSPLAGAEDGGFDGLPPDGSLAASAPGAGTFHFSIDDQPATAVPGRPSSGRSRATFDPPGDLASQTHLFVIAYVDGNTISAVAGTFLVEG